jgi:hypothetical protein
MKQRERRYLALFMVGVALSAAASNCPWTKTTNDTRSTDCSGNGYCTYYNYEPSWSGCGSGSDLQNCVTTSQQTAYQQVQQGSCSNPNGGTCSGGTAIDSWGTNNNNVVSSTTDCPHS